MKTYFDANKREYYIKEGEIHYVDEELAPRKKKPQPARKFVIAVIGGAGMIAVFFVGLTVFGNPHGTRNATSELNFVRTLVVMEQTQTAEASIPSSATARPRNGRETVFVPFNQYAPTYTQGLYSGSVELVISGFGQAGGKDYSDAFYLYQSEDGTPIDPPRREEFDLEIDSRRAIITLGLRENPPPFSSDHTYQVTYDVGQEFRQIAFRISDEVVGDNIGQFVIEVTG